MPAAVAIKKECVRQEDDLPRQAYSLPCVKSVQPEHFRQMGLGASVGIAGATDDLRKNSGTPGADSTGRAVL